MSRERTAGYERILGAIRATRAAIRRGDLALGAGRALLVAGAAAVALVALDNLFRLSAGFRIALLVAAVGATGYAAWRWLVRPVRRRITDDAVAVRIEESAGGMDNVLINALQLGREETRDPLSGAIARSLVERGAERAARCRPGRVVDLRRVFRSLGFGMAAVLLVVLYDVALPDHFANAVARYASPTSFVPPVSATRIAVDPGDAAVLYGSELRISAVATGAMPSRARILVLADGDEEPSEMLFDGRAFAFRFSAVTEPFDYRIEAGDASSPIYHVSVVRPPDIESLTLTFRYPDYLGRPERTEANASGDIRAPVGTRVGIMANLTRPVVDAAIELGRRGRTTLVREGDRRVSGGIEVVESDTWALLLQTPEGIGNRNPVTHRIEALPDEIPRVELTEPGKDVTVSLPARVAVTVRASDDHGLTEIALRSRRGETGETQSLRTWSVAGDARRVVRHEIELPAGALGPGETLVVWAQARDAWPKGDHLGRSRPVTIRVISREDQARETGGALTELESALRMLLEKEQGLNRDTVAVRQAVAGGELGLSGLPARASSLSETQSRIGAEMVSVAGTVPTDVPALSEVRGTLLSLAMNEVMEAVRRIQDSRSRDDPVTATRDLTAAEQSEGVIIERLTDLLGRVGDLLDRLEDDPDAWMDEKADEADPKAALEDVLAKLAEFLREQREVIRQTRELEKKEAEDFTDDDLRLLEKLAAKEAELARFLEDLKDDLSKIPDQDFSNSTVLKELIEAYSEVELAADALSKKSIELAVPLEQSGLELAESLTENIEKWLPDTADRVKWNMEEFDGELPDVPMAELPEQLEDLIGELIEGEDDLAEDIEDVTSGWADSIDKGAGWGVSDGPISNMSAQGKTGNVLPNSSEVGGRSGEGRTGRSHGEMVEGEATGKGGRRTPTRLTPDAIEGKAVKDSSKDPIGGATGGGKLSGTAGEGLRGPLPPQVKGELPRLAGRQVAIRQRAEKLDRALEDLGYPDEAVSRSVVLMKEMEEALGHGDFVGFSRRHGQLVEQLEGGRKELVEHARVVRDRASAVPKEILREVESVDLEDLPEGYREMLREYYKILSRGAEK